MGLLMPGIDFDIGKTESGCQEGVENALLTADNSVNTSARWGSGTSKVRGRPSNGMVTSAMSDSLRQDVGNKHDQLRDIGDKDQERNHDDEKR